MNSLVTAPGVHFPLPFPWAFSLPSISLGHFCKWLQFSRVSQPRWEAEHGAHPRGRVRASTGREPRTWALHALSALAASTWGPILCSAAPLFLTGPWTKIAVAAVSYMARACLSSVVLCFAHGSVWRNGMWLCSAQMAAVVGIYTKWDFKHEWLFLMKIL